MRSAASVVGGIVMMASINAAAAPFATKGSVVLGAENLAGFGITKVDAEGDLEVSATYISLLGNADHQTPYDMPRLAFDFFVTDHLSIGGSVTYARTSTEINGSGAAALESKASGIFLAPRIGYGMVMGSRLGLWVRGGVTYFSTKDETGQLTSTVKGAAINLDPALLLFLNDFLALGVGPTINVPLSGSVDQGGPESDFKISTYGLSVGLHGTL